jgi:hypothetical protein
MPFGSSKSQPFQTSSSQTSQTSQPSQTAHTFSMIEIDGKIYYLASLNIDDCIINYSHTMTTPLLETFTNYSTGLSDQRMTTIVFENIDSQAQPQAQPQEKKVVGFWNPQLSKFILNV